MMSKSTAFTLVEVLLAMTIMGIAITGILTTFSASLVGVRVSRDYALADTMMTELRSYLRSDTFSPFEINQGNFTNHSEFSWQVNYYYTEIENLYQVQLVIGWVRGSREHTVDYITYHYTELTEEDLTTSESSSEASSGSSGGR